MRAAALLSVIILAVLAFVAVPVPAQSSLVSFQLLEKFQGPEAGDDHGISLAFTGDIDRDGFPDILVGAPGSSPGGLLGAGSVFLYSGKTFTLLHRFDGQNSGDDFGISVLSPGDLDGDSIPDILIGADSAAPANRTNAGSVYVFSGASFVPVGRLDGEAAFDEFGASATGLGDLNGNGRPEFAVGAPEASPDVARTHAGRVYVYSDNMGLMRRIDGQAAQDSFGISLAGPGDSNRDNVPDLLVGADVANPGGRVNAGSAYLYSGSSFTILAKLEGEAGGDFFGFSVAGVGDVDRDGRPDILVGAPAADPSGTTDAGSAYLFSGANYTLLHRFDGRSRADDFGSAVATAGDQNRDGYSELLISADLADSAGILDLGSVFVYSGKDYSVMGQVDGEVQGDSMGYSVAGNVDTDADGSPEILLGAPFNSAGTLTEAGTVYLYTLVNRPVARFTVTPFKPISGEPVRFDASSSTDPDGTIVGYSWDFGDGTTGAGITVTHLYSSGATVVVRLTVADDQGQTNTETQTIAMNEPPSANLSLSPSTTAAGQPVRYDASSSTDPDGTIVGYSWDFGDGTSATGVIVGHTYNSDGTFTVTLTTTDDSGASSTIQQTIVVGPAAPVGPRPETYLLYGLLAGLAMLIALGLVLQAGRRRGNLSPNTTP